MPKEALMAWYPGAKRLPITHNVGGRRARTRGVILHVDGGNAASLRGFFNTPGRNASSHFYVTLDGTVEQYVDTDLLAWTSGAANSSTIGIETQGLGGGAWTEAQMQALVKLVRWICQEHGIPIKAMKSSRPNEKGIGTHRLGCDGNFPAAGVQRGRLQRAKKGLGESWSSSRGKVCPGDRRQAQWHEVVRRAQTHVVAKRTVGRTGAAAYKAAKVGAKNITRLLPVGTVVRVVKIGKAGKWTKLAKGDRMKLSKLKGSQ